MRSAPVIWSSLCLTLFASAAGAATLSCLPASGPAGGSATVQFSVSGDGAGVVATQNDFSWDLTLLSLQTPGSSTAANCRINPAIGPGTALDKLLSVGFLDINLARALLVAQTNFLAVPDGLLFSCTFQIAADAPRGATGIALSNFIASDADTERIMPAQTGDCEVMVTDPPPTPTPKGFCNDDEDCPEGQVCVDNRCVTPTPIGFCDDDEDCPPDEECIDNRCRPRPTATPTPSPTPEGFCNDDRDCPEGQVCIDNFCATPTPVGFCEDDEDCPPGQTCIDNRCTDPSPTPVGFCEDDEDCPEGEECVDNRCQPKSGGGGGGCNCSIDPTAPDRAALNLLLGLLPVGALLAARRRSPTGG
jgi:MYXO-CTERM domain-containing protein